MAEDDWREGLTPEQQQEIQDQIDQIGQDLEETMRQPFSEEEDAERVLLHCLRLAARALEEPEPEELPAVGERIPLLERYYQNFTDYPVFSVYQGSGRAQVTITVAKPINCLDIKLIIK